MKNHKIIIISIISVISIGIIAGIWILVSPDSVKDTDRLTSVSDTDPVIVDIENQEQADSRKEGKDQSELKELAEGRADTGMDPDDGSDETKEKLQNVSGAGQKIEQNNKKTAEYKQEASTEAVRESNPNSAATISVVAENKTEQTTATADSTPVTTTENKSDSTTEAAPERKTEATTEATTRSTTQSTTESTTEAATTAHTHTWKAVYKTVKHEEVGHWEEVEAGQLEHPIVEGHIICSNPGCGYDYDLNGNVTSSGGVGYHQCADGTVGSNYHNENVTVGYWYETFYDDVWVVDQKAYTEQVVDYYECSECGARK